MMIGWASADTLQVTFTGNIYFTFDGTSFQGIGVGDAFSAVLTYDAVEPDLNDYNYAVTVQTTGGPVIVPYQTKSDVLRFCLHFGLRELESQVGLGLELTTLEVVNDVVNRHQERLAFAKSAESLIKTVNDLERIGARDEARRLVSDSLAKVSEMEPTSLTKWYRDEVTKCCAHLLREVEAGPS